MALNIGNSAALWWQARIDNALLQKDALVTQNIFKRTSDQIRGLTGISGFGIAATLGLKELVGTTIKFEKAISVLSSLTGAVGDELEYYKQKSIEFGAVTTQSASQVADGIRLIGSSMPQLLQNKEALTDVTRAMITLAEAAEITVPEAARALTLSLNQTNAEADQAANYINILAAASRNGAGEIPYITDALEKSGKIAFDAGLSYSETVAAIEMLAPTIAEASEAGTHFRNILLQLQKGGYGFSTGKFNLQEALYQVRAELDGIADPAARAAREIDIFDVRALSSGKVLLDNRDKFKQFAQSIEGTNVAYEQAETNTNNVEGSLLKLKAAVEGAILKNADFQGGLKSLIDTLTDVVTWLGENWSWIEKLIKAYLLYIVTIKGTNVAIQLYTRITELAKIGTEGFNKALKANVLGLIVATIYLAIQAFKSLNASMTETEAREKRLNDINKEVNDSVMSQKIAIGLLYGVATDYNRSQAEREKAIKAINKISPEFLGNITEETIRTGEAKKAIDSYILALEDKIRAEVVQNKLADITKEIFEEETDRYEKVRKAREALYSDKMTARQKKVLEDRLKLLYENESDEIEQLKKIRDEYLKMANSMDIDILAGVTGGANEPYIPKGGDGGTKTAEEESLYEKYLRDFDLIQEFELKKYQLITANELMIEQFRNDQQIARYEFMKENADNISGLEKNIYDVEVETIKKRNAEILIQLQMLNVKTADMAEKTQKELSDKQKANMELMARSFELVGEVVNETFTENENRLESFVNALRKATIEIVSILIARAIAVIAADTIEKYKIAGIALVPVITGITAAVLNAAIPKFASGKAADYTSGGKVGGQGTQDTQLGLFKANEIVLNQQQQANLLWGIANGALGNNRVEGLLKEQNDLLKNSKTAIIRGNTMYVIKNGQLTGEKVML